MKDLLADPAARDAHDIAHRIVAVGSSSSVEKSKGFIAKVGADSSVVACGSYEELVSVKDVDIIYIATPHRYVLFLFAYHADSPWPSFRPAITTRTGSWLSKLENMFYARLVLRFECDVISTNPVADPESV